MFTFLAVIESGGICFISWCPWSWSHGIDRQIRMLCVLIVVSQTLSAATCVDTTRTGSWYREVATCHLSHSAWAHPVHPVAINIRPRSYSFLIMIDTIRGSGCCRIRIHIVECFVEVFECGII